MSENECHGFGKCFWLSSSKVWRENFNPSPDAPFNGLPFHYSGYYVHESRNGAATCTFKDGRMLPTTWLHGKVIDPPNIDTVDVDISAEPTNRDIAAPTTSAITTMPADNMATRYSLKPVSTPDEAIDQPSVAPAASNSTTRNTSRMATRGSKRGALTSRESTDSDSVSKSSNSSTSSRRKTASRVTSISSGVVSRAARITTSKKIKSEPLEFIPLSPSAEPMPKRLSGESSHDASGRNTTAVMPSSSTSIKDKLKELKNLFDEGLLAESVFIEAQKKVIEKL